MPLSKYNRAFGGKPGAAAKAKAAMREKYGDRGEEVFYRTVAKKRPGLVKRKD